MWRAVVFFLFRSRPCQVSAPWTVTLGFSKFIAGLAGTSCPARGRTNPGLRLVLAERQPVGPNQIRSYVTPSRSKEEEEFPSLSHHPDGAMPGLNTVEKMGKTLDPLSLARALITTCTLPTPVPTCPLSATRSTRTCETKNAHACVLTKSQCAVGVNGTRLCLLLLPSQTPASPVVYHFIDIVLS